MTARRAKFKDRLERDCGAALVTVLLLVGVMAVAAISSFEALGFAVKRTTNDRLYKQARLYAIGGEHIARRAAEQVAKTDQALLSSIGFDGANEIRFPIEGGVILGRIEDTSNCFNVNSLVQRTDLGVLVENPEMGLRYQLLLQGLGLSENEAEVLVAATTDWLDSDTRALPRGAEDYDYAIEDVPYRAANTLIADKGELNLISGYTLDLYQRIKPYVCVLPNSDSARLNVNSLRPEHAPLVASLVGEPDDLGALQGMIAERPARGFETVSDFWLQSVFEGQTISQSVRSAVSLKPEQFSATIEVQYFDASVYMSSHIVIGNDGKSEVIGRQFGALPQ